MQWDWQNRRLKLSVGDLSRFSLATPGEETSGRWRVELGSHWHAVLRQRAEETNSGWLFERPVRGTLLQENWSFELNGRIDQIQSGSRTTLIREVKTVSCPLPADPEWLRESYPQYFHQAMLYAFLHGMGSEFPEAELVFLEIASGSTQTVPLDDTDLEALHTHVSMVAQSLEERRGHFRRLRALEIPEPFPQWRPGQPEARESLQRAFSARKPILFEAPTGFGKTGIALELALRELAIGAAERIILLTGKNTGHSPLLRQLEAFREKCPELAVQVMRSRKDHLLDPEREQEFTRRDIIENWIKSGLSAPQLLHNGILDLDEIRALGQRHSIPPWAITRFLMPYADVWVADFNYLFDPAVSQVLEGIPAYSPDKTILIIDEAHNLPGRAAASRSHLIDRAAIEKAYTEAQLARFPGRLGKLLDLLLTMVKRQNPDDSLDPPMEADFIGLLREIDSAVRESSFGIDELSEESREWLWEIPATIADWDDPLLSIHPYAPRRGCIHLACIDASRTILEVLLRFRKSILMSATLRPWESFGKAIGINDTESCARIQGEAPWLDGCFEVIVDARVDTRFQKRSSYMDKTAETVAQTADTAGGCTIVFFPSYRYAENVLERMQFLHPYLRVEIQPRNLDLEGQYAFLESALLFDDVVFLILGSRFSEGIDLIGGKIKTAIVVSPALPEVNAVQKARERLIAGNSKLAFREVYLIPGIQKISQALGRLVRSPDHSAKVLLHGQRFADPSHQNLLPEYLSPTGTVVDDNEFEEKWLSILLR